MNEQNEIAAENANASHYNLITQNERRLPEILRDNNLIN